MKQTIKMENEVEIDWAKMYQLVKDDIIVDGVEPDKYQVLDHFKVNNYSFFCDYFECAEDEFLDGLDLKEADEEFEDYIESLSD